LLELRKFCLAPRGQFPTDKSCSKFVNCWDEVAVESDCPGGLVFNPAAGFCDYPYNVDCGNRPVESEYNSEQITPHSTHSMIVGIVTPHSTQYDCGRCHTTQHTV
jgi:hypothetical protein